MDLQHFLNTLAESNQLLRISDPVDPFLEINALSALAVRNHGPALLFTNARGSRHPILTNALASGSRLSMALHHESLPAFGAAAHRLLEEGGELGDMELPVLAHPPCQEHVHMDQDAGFHHLPLITSWPGDAGPCMTAGVVATRDPDTGERNAGIYRMQFLDNHRATLGWHPGSDAARHFAAASRRELPLQVAVAVGVPPAALLAAGLPWPAWVDELRFAGQLSGTKLELARCRTLDLLVPATSQFVLEGHAIPGLLAMEGPFGNHTGTQTKPRQCPVFELQAVTHVHAPVFQGITTGPPPSESTWLAKAHEAVLRVQLQSDYTDILDICLPMEGIFQNLLFIQLRSGCRDALELMRSLLDRPGLRRFRFLVAVDEGVDVGDSSQVLWRMGNCLDPDRDMLPVQGPLAVWHPTATPGQGTKLLLDARVKSGSMPIPHHPDPAFTQKIIQLWHKHQQR